MILFVNGSFGVGKTTIADLLVKRIPNSMLYDPEEVGICLSHIVRPIEQFEDFQDLPMWRTLTVTTARLLKQTYGRTLIMPMTVWNEPYFHEIMHGLRQFEPDLLHVCLTARAETIFARLESRRHEHTAENYRWISRRVERCVQAFQSPTFAVHVATDGRTPEEIANSIVTSLFPPA